MFNVQYNLCLHLHWLLPPSKKKDLVGTWFLLHTQIKLITCMGLRKFTFLLEFVHHTCQSNKVWKQVTDGAKGYCRTKIDFKVFDIPILTTSGYDG